MKKFKYIIVLFVMGLISFSCTDLDEEIFSEITTDNYYQTMLRLLVRVGLMLDTFYRKLLPTS